MFISDAFCRWEGSSTDEVGKNKETGKVLVRVNPKYYRPTEVVSTVHHSPHYMKILSTHVMAFQVNAK